MIIAKKSLKKSQTQQTYDPFKLCTIVFSWPERLLVVWKNTAKSPIKARNLPNGHNQLSSSSFSWASVRTYPTVFGQSSSILHSSILYSSAQPHLFYTNSKSHKVLVATYPLKNYGFVHYFTLPLAFSAHQMNITTHSLCNIVTLDPGHTVPEPSWELYFQWQSKWALEQWQPTWRHEHFYF